MLGFAIELAGLVAVVVVFVIYPFAPCTADSEHHYWNCFQVSRWRSSFDPFAYWHRLVPPYCCNFSHITDLLPGHMSSPYCGKMWVIFVPDSPDECSCNIAFLFTTSIFFPVNGCLLAGRRLLLESL